MYLGFIPKKVEVALSFSHERHLEDPDISLTEAEL